MRDLRKKSIIFILFGVLLMVPGLAGAEVGVTDTTIKIGSIQDTTGPLAGYGTPRVEAVRALFQHVNDTGGIHGRKLKLVLEGDLYKPSNTVAAFKKLVEVDKIFCFMSNLGLSTTIAIGPELERKGIPLIGVAYSKKLFDVSPNNIFGIVAGFDDFGRILLDYLVKDLKMPNATFSHIMQQGESGVGFQRGITAQLKRYPGLKQVSTETFKYGTVDVASQVANAKRANPQVVIISPLFAPSAMICKEIKKIGWNPIKLMGASSGSPALIKLGGKAVEGAVVQVIQRLISDDIPSNRFYKKVMKKYYPNSKVNPSQWGLTGWYESMIGIEGLRRAGRNLTREGLVKAMEAMKGYDVGGGSPPVTYGPGIRQGSHAVVHVKVENGKFVNLTGWRSPIGLVPEF